jgi:hypothetical protein
LAIILGPIETADVGQEGDGSGAFNFHSQFALMFGTGSRNTTRDYFTPFRYKHSQGTRIFVVDCQVTVRAKTTDFASMEYFASTAVIGPFFISLIGISHDPILPPLLQG